MIIYKTINIIGAITESSSNPNFLVDNINFGKIKTDRGKENIIILNITCKETVPIPFLN